MTHTKPKMLRTDNPLQLIKPAFFAGQYLSEVDLQSIVGWADKSLRFALYGQPWGIVQGLYIAVSNDGASKLDEDQLAISPGWAWNANHELCIVDETIRLPLPNDESQECRREISARVAGPWRSVDPDILKDIKITQVIDLVIQPSEDVAAHSLGASVVGRKNCHASSYKASSKISFQRINLDSLEQKELSPSHEKVEVAWLTDYSQKFTKAPTLDEFKQWLSWKIKQEPRAMRLWPKIIDYLRSEKLEEAIPRILEWLCFSLRTTRELHIGQQPSVPLARLWLTRIAGVRRVFWIDEQAAYRKQLTQTVRQFVCADWIGADFSTAHAAAADMGISLEEAEWPVNATISEMEKYFGDEPHALTAGATSLQALVTPLVRDLPDRKIIVAFAQPALA